MDRFPLLFSPLRIGTSLTLRNRLVLSPHTTVFSAPGGYLTQRDADYWSARAKGGVALTVLGTNVVHTSSPIDYGVLANLDDSYIPGLSAGGGCGACPRRGPVRAVEPPGPRHARPRHAAVARALGVPVLHVRRDARPAGRGHHSRDCAGVRGGGGALPARGGRRTRPRRARLPAQRVPFAAHQSPCGRVRRQAFDNRMRLLREVLASIRAAVGRDYPVGVRLSVDELVPGGLTLDESLEIVRWLDRNAAVDYIDVSCGVDYDWMSHGRHYPGMHRPDGTWTHLAAAVKAAVQPAGELRRAHPQPRAGGAVVGGGHAGYGADGARADRGPGAARTRRARGAWRRSAPASTSRRAAWGGCIAA